MAMKTLEAFGFFARKISRVLWVNVANVIDAYLIARAAVYH